MPTYLLVLIIILAVALFLVVAFFAMTFFLFKVTIGRKFFIGKIVNKQFNKDLKEYKIDRNWWKSQQVEKLCITNNGTKLAGFFIKSKTQSKKLAIVIHGYYSSHIDLTPQVKIFADNGFNVFCPDLRGHGKSEGNVVGMAYLDHFDMLKWIELLINKLGKDVQIVISGWSMGAATACMLSGRKLPSNVKGIISDSSYTSAYSEFEFLLKQRHLPYRLVMWLANMGAKMFGRYDFKDASPLLCVAKSTLPILFIHGNKDSFVPSFMTEELYNAKTTGFKQIEIFDGAEHIKSYATDTARYVKLFEGFIAKFFD